MNTKIFFRNKHTIVGGATAYRVYVYRYIGGKYTSCPHANNRVVRQHNLPICILCSRPKGIVHHYCSKQPGEICTPEDDQPPGTTV